MGNSSGFLFLGMGRFLVTAEQFQHTFSEYVCKLTFFISRRMVGSDDYLTHLGGMPVKFMGYFITLPTAQDNCAFEIGVTHKDWASIRKIIKKKPFPKG